MHQRAICCAERNVRPKFCTNHWPATTSHWAAGQSDLCSVMHIHHVNIIYIIYSSLFIGSAVAFERPAKRPVLGTDAIANVHETIDRPNAFNPPTSSDPKRIDQLVCVIVKPVFKHACWSTACKASICSLKPLHNRSTCRWLAVKATPCRSILDSLSTISSRRTIHWKPICYLPAEKVRSAESAGNQFVHITVASTSPDCLEYSFSHFNCKRRKAMPNKRPMHRLREDWLKSGKSTRQRIFNASHSASSSILSAFSESNHIKASKMMKKKDWRILERERERQIKDWNSQYNQNKF